MKKKHLPLLTLPFTILFFCFGVFLAQKDSASLHTARLYALTDRFFKEELSSSLLNLHYTLADPSAYGIDSYSVDYGSYSAQSLADSQILIENYQAALNVIDPAKLSDNDRFTWEVLAYMLEQAEEGTAWYYYDEPLSPSLGIQAQLPILLAEYAFYQERDISDYLTLLSRTDSYFQSILEFEQEKVRRGLFLSDKTLENIVNQCIDFINDGPGSYLTELFDEKLESLSGLSEDKKQTYRLRHQELLSTCFYPAYEQLVNGLMALKGSGCNSGGLCHLPNGTAYYTYLVRTVTGSERTPEAIWRLLNDKRTEYASQIQKLLTQNPSLIHSMDLSIESKDPKKILSELKKQIRMDFPDLPDTRFTVKEVHPSLQAYSSPAFYLTPPLDRITDNTIYINPSDSGFGMDLFTTLAHEGYPGHMYQTVYSHANCTNPLQSILNIGGYTEGWATYAELYACKLAGLDPNTALLLLLNKSWTLNLYCTIDLGVHYYGWSSYDVYEFLNSYGIPDLHTAQEIYQLIIEDPANYLKYYLGYLEFEAMKQKASAALGDNFNLREFHQELLTLGPAPFILLNDRMDAYIARKD